MGNSVQVSPLLSLCAYDAEGEFLSSEVIESNIS